MSIVSVLICNSNMFVPYVLSEVLMHKDESFLIMSDIENMVRFFNEMSLQNTAVMRYFQPSSRTIIKSRRELLQQTGKYDIQRIVFFHAEFGGIINWFLKKQARAGVKIFYCKVFNSLPHRKVLGLKALKFKFSYLLLNGVDVDVIGGGSRFIPSLPQRFYKSIEAEPCTIKIDYDAIKHCFSQHFPDVCCAAKVVLLTGSTVSMDIVSEDEYTCKTDALIEAIGKENCVAKCHPRFNDVFGEERELRTIPAYIPGNLVIGYYDVFIGSQSTLLVEAAIAGKLAVSLLDYYSLKDVSQGDLVKAFFRDRLAGRGVIHFPKTVEEMMDLIKTKG